MPNKKQQTLPVPECPKAQQILYPHRSDLHGDLKPKVIHVRSPWDKKDAATNASSAWKLLNDLGFIVLNKQEIKWTATKKELDSAVKPVIKGTTPQLTIWIDAHGGLGWFFGSEGNKEDEFKDTSQFRHFVKAIEDRTGLKVVNVVLSGCFTANEIFNPDNGAFFCSPARMLSYFLPDVNVVGFVGKHACAKIDGLYEKKGQTYSPIVVSLHEAAVIYNNGNVKERYSRELYCNYKYMGFACGLIDITVDDKKKETTYYAPTNAPETAKCWPYRVRCYGDHQIADAETKQKKKQQPSDQRFS
jgi:hypothetical protein